MAMLFQFLGAFLVGLAFLNVHLAIKRGGGLLNSFVAGFVLTLGILLIYKTFQY